MTIPLSRSRFTLVVAALFVVAVTLSSCSSARADLQESTADHLQSGVLEVTTAAAAEEYASALSALTALQASLLTASTAGQVSAARSAEIQSAINLVNEDLVAAIAASTPTPTPSPTPTTAPDPGNGNGNGNCKKKDTCDEGDEGDD